jgi:hypothetical protein
MADPREGADVDVVWHAWRAGDRMVMGEDARLPDRCVKTDLPAHGQTADLQLLWHRPALYWLLALNLVIYAVVTRYLGTTVVLHVGVTNAVLRAYRRARVLTWVLYFGGAAAWAVAGAGELPLLFWLGLLLMVLAIPVLLLGARLVRVTRLEEGYVWIAGVHPDYLASLPEWTG